MKLFVFDLDNTLTESRTPIDTDAAILISKLLEKKKVAVISGATFERFKIQFLSGFSSTKNFENLFLLPTSGAELCEFKNGSWNTVYREKIPDGARREVIKGIARLAKIPADEESIFIDDREGQVTYAALGLDAPLEEKKKYDPDEKRRRDFVGKIAPKFPNLFFRIGGTSSIDVTPKGIDKAFGIRKLAEYAHVDIADTVFIGDALYKGGNDEAAKAAGEKVVATSGPEETKKIILKFINED